MLKFDNITVITPTLIEGVSHFQNCLGLEVPFGTRHEYMVTHNHRLQLGKSVSLAIVELDPNGVSPSRVRWFGLDNQETVRSNWNESRRLRGWVASTGSKKAFVSTRCAIFGDEVPLPVANPAFAFSIPEDGSLPLDGVAPSLIDHRSDPNSMTEIPSLVACLRSLTLKHPDPAAIETLYRELSIDHPPAIVQGSKVRYRAKIETSAGLKELT